MSDMKTSITIVFLGRNYVLEALFPFLQALVHDFRPFFFFALLALVPIMRAIMVQAILRQRRNEKKEKEEMKRRGGMVEARSDGKERKRE